MVVSFKWRYASWEGGFAIASHRNAAAESKADRIALDRAEKLVRVRIDFQRGEEGNVEIARGFTPLSEKEMERMRKQLTPSREGLEHNLVGHLDGPTETPEMFRV